MIYTDADGVPLVKPDRADYSDAGEYMRAWYAWKDRITEYANREFDEAFREELRKCGA